MPCPAHPGADGLGAPCKGHLPRQTKAYKKIFCGGVWTSDIHGVAGVLELPCLDVIMTLESSVPLASLGRCQWSLSSQCEPQEFTEDKMIHMRRT